MRKEHAISNWYLGEASALAGTPGTEVIRNDYGEKVFPHGFTSDTTTLSPKEITDAIIYMSTVEPRLLNAYLNQLEDNISTITDLKQAHRLADLKIRQFMASFALTNADKLGQFGTTIVAEK